MRYSFIGMSNIGKSTWSKRLAAEKNCARIDCDVLIEKKLTPELEAGDHRGLVGVAKWMGFPADAQYAENSAIYMACEHKIMRESLGLLRANRDMGAVIDTTGSVVYCDDDIWASLRTETRVIYLEASEEHIADLFKRYMAHPKPVIWGDHYLPQEGETARQTLKHCYPALLRDRAARYRALAHVTIPFERHRDRRGDISEFLGAA